jgi:N-acetylmuramoyl-L-alanine amidase
MPGGSSEGDRVERRKAELASVKRQRRLAALAVLVVAGAGAYLAVALTGASAGSGEDPTTQRQATPTAQALPARTIVAGSKANEQTSSTVATTSKTRTAGSAAVAPLRGKTIAVDPGHNGDNYLHTAEINRLVDAGTLRKACDTTGTETADGYTEAAYNLDVSIRLAKILRAEGAHVVLTRTTNTGWGPCITDRAAIGNRAHADAAISIHADGGPASGRGFHVIYPPREAGLISAGLAETDRRLALAVRDAYRATGMPNSTYLGSQGLDERSDLGGLNLSRVPKVFVETGNMRNATDATLLESASFRQKAAAAIARGLRSFLHR